MNVETAATRAGIEGSSARAAGRYWLRLARDPLAGYVVLRRDFGDAVRLPFAPRRAFYLLSRPEHAEHVLVAHQDRYVKAFTYRPLKAFLGDGLLTSEGGLAATPQPGPTGVEPPAHTGLCRRHDRRRTGPSRHLASQRHPRRSSRDAHSDDGCGGPSAVRNQSRPASGTGRAGRVPCAAGCHDRHVPAHRRLTPRHPTASTRIPGVAGAIATIESVVDGIIAERSASPRQQPRDLLDLFIAATNDERSLSVAEIRDEVMTLILAGHETTANALTWALMLLSRFPAARERLSAEVDDILAGREPVATDADNLTWTAAVICEAMPPTRRPGPSSAMP